MKRLFDLIISLITILLMTPLLIIIYCMVLCIMGRPVLFKQYRPGFKGKPFVVRKFRTMLTMTDCRGNLLPDEIRLTNFGRFLRSTSLDELPALFNVLKGDLSFIGPRPLLMEYLPLYSTEQARRHEIKPGITGWAQVNGRNAISWEEKFKLDVWYVDNRSFWLDCKILWLTLLKVFSREGITQSGHATMEKFKGNEKANDGQVQKLEKTQNH